MEIQESKVTKILYNQVSLGIAIAAAVFWILNYVNNPINQVKLDIALIQQSIGVISNEHIKYSTNAKDRDDKIIEIDKKIERILTTLENLKK